MKYQTKGSSKPSIVFTCVPDSDHVSLTISSSMSAPDVLDNVLKLPQTKVTKKNEKQDITAKLFASLMMIITLQILVEVKKEERAKKA